MVPYLKSARRTFLRYAMRMLYFGSTQYCSVCERSSRRFLDHGSPPRRNIKCPQCLSLDRHRLDWLFFKRKTDLFDGTPKRMLHVAPERWLVKRLSNVPGLDYLSADLYRPAMVKMDITDIQYPEDYFDVIYCSHVLEHVPDDRRALSEFFRVLRPGGWAVLQVPIRGEKTWEDLSITDPDERARLFGQADHLRACGPDYIERMRDAGFEGEVVRARDFLNDKEMAQMSISGERIVFYCRKPQ